MKMSLHIAGQAASGHELRIAELTRVVLSLYGATPLPTGYNPRGNLGQMIVGGRSTLVLVASPGEVIDVAAVKKACLLRDVVMGGWDEITLLCWEVETNLGRCLARWSNRQLDVVMIPPGLLDCLNEEGGADRMKGRVCFISLLRRHISIESVKRTPLAARKAELLVVTLENYIPCLREVADRARLNGSELQVLMGWGPLALIEYWAVDPAYDRQVFRPVWHCYRGDGAIRDLLPVGRQAALTLPLQPGIRRVCVRTVDVFCHASEVVVTVAAPTPSCQSKPGSSRPLGTTL